MTIITLMPAVFKDKLTSNNYILYGAIRLLAAAMLISFAIFCVYDLYFSESGQQVRTQATVIDSAERVLGEGTKSEETIYTPVLKYSVNGQTYTTNQGVQARSQPYSIGSSVEIQYSPSDPGHPFQPNISRSHATWILVAVVALPGIALFIRTVAQIVAIRRDILQTLT